MLPNERWQAPELGWEGMAAEQCCTTTHGRHKKRVGSAKEQHMGIHPNVQNSM